MDDVYVLYDDIGGYFDLRKVGNNTGTMSKHMYSTANLSDKELKEQGNRFFSLRRFEDAMSCYTKAIVSTVRFSFLTYKQVQNCSKICLNAIVVFSVVGE